MKKIERLRVLGKYLVSGAVNEADFDMAEWPSCAIGEARDIPSLFNEGFTFDDSGSWPSYNGSIGFYACAEFFGLPYTKARQLFGADNDTNSGNHSTAIQVGKRILRYINRKGKSK